MSIIRKIYGWKLPALGLMALIFALFVVLGKKPAPNREILTPPPSVNYIDTIAGIGIVEPQSEIINIGVEIPGVVREVYVKVGDKVSAGQPLFALDQREIEARIKTLEAQLNSAKVQAEEAEEKFNLVNGLKEKNAISPEDFNHRKFGSAFAKSRVAEIEAELQHAFINKERQVVQAPIDGIVLDIQIKPGEYANIGALPTPLIRIGDMSTLHVRVEIDEQYASKITEDLPAQGFIRGSTTSPIPLKFVRFEPYVRAKQNLATANQRVDTRVLQIIYALPKDYTGIYVGQQMDVFIEQQ